MAGRSSYFYHCDEAPAAWADGTTMDEVEKEAREYKRKFEAHTQFVFSNVQHHWHPYNEKTKKREPTTYCRRKLTKKGECLCKQDFPKILVPKSTVVCAGNAKKLGMRVSGRRNALGTMLATRQCAYFSGTSPILAHAIISNTNVQTPCRLPITAQTHDPNCKRSSCLQTGNARTVSYTHLRAHETR